VARIPGLDVSGDLRIRQEFNRFGSGERSRSRTVLRGRLRASYEVAPNLTVGAQLSTGDPDDPKSVDVTLGNFVDDLNVSLDQAWVRYRRGGLTAFAGKFPQIFARTDMLWDGDVAPEGVGIVYSAPLGERARFDARGIYFVIDEAPAARDSDMLGGQLVAAAPLSPSLDLTLAGGYFHYRLGSVAGADAGDFRGNLLAAGRYLSDFHLLEGLATLRWAGASPRWPIVLTADYVRNLGAAVPADTGFNIEVAAGRTLVPGDWRIAYNFSEVEADAVVAAVSHDNLAIGTNYRLHGLGLSYVPAPGVQFDAIYYRYRTLDRVYAGVDDPRGWLDRLRLNMVLSF
jgi:hypothetical protein